jgi:hypothetical protein
MRSGKLRMQIPTRRGQQQRIIFNEVRDEEEGIRASEIRDGRGLD